MSNRGAIESAQEEAAGTDLWRRVVAQSERALASGALQPMTTQTVGLTQAGSTFTVYTPTGAHRRLDPKNRALIQQRADQAAGQSANPFLPPYEPDLFVADVSATHVCLLNKFPVLANHLLILPRAYESQEDLLTLADFQALWRCLAQVDGLAFYNGGPVAGASQPHKHLQLVPAQGNGGRDLIPLEARLSGSPGLPFAHAFVRLDPRLARRPELAAQASFDHYHRLLRAAGLQRKLGEPGQPGPYNLLMTRRWMFVAPRRRLEAAGIDVNSLGFAGSLLVRSPEELAYLRRCTPLLLLRAVVDGRGRVGAGQRPVSGCTMQLP